MKSRQSSDISWGKPAKSISDALDQISKNCTSLQFEHRFDPYSDGVVNFARSAGDRIVNPHLGDEGVVQICEALMDNKSCRALDLSGNKIHSEGIGAIVNLLEKNKKIEILYLEDNNLTDEDVRYLAEHLEKNESLKQLALSGNKITDVGAIELARGLKKNKNLESLWLNRNLIRDEGAKKLAKMLKKNDHITTLCLEQNHIRERGAKLLAKSLKKNENLNVLNLAGNKIGPKGAVYFSKSLKKINKKMDMKSKKEGEDDKKEDRKVELILAGNRMNEDDLEKLKGKWENDKVKLPGRVKFDHSPKGRVTSRMLNYLKFHMMDKKYAKQGHFDYDKEVEKVL